MTSPDYEYTKNLEWFLQHSEEDLVDSKTFLKTFPALDGLSHDYNFKWLDVGAGPGTKPINILRGVNDHRGLISYGNVALDVLEPSKDWQRILLKNFQESELGYVVNKVYPIKWEEFIQKRHGWYDLITFFHSVYGIETESLKDIPRFLKEVGYACIVVESPNSDLQKIKRSVFPYFHRREFVSSSQTVTEFLDKVGIRYKSSEEDPQQKFYIDDLLDSNNPNRITPLSFVIQTTPEDYNKTITQGTQDKVEKKLRKLVKKDEEGKMYLDVPDRFIWISK